MTEIIPSILVKTREEMVEKIMAIEPYVERAHLDIADGIFVPNMTIAGFEELDDIETDLKMTVHLMVSKPENHIDRWLETQADQFIFHIEATEKAQEVIDKIKEADRLAGIAVNPQTPISAIEPFIDQADMVHFMTVEPGFYGSPFVESVVSKIADFHFYYPDKLIGVDGGVDPDTAPQLIGAGVSQLVAGSYIFKSKNPAEAIEKLKKIAESEVR